MRLTLRQNIFPFSQNAEYPQLGLGLTLWKKLNCISHTACLFASPRWIEAAPTQTEWEVIIDAVQRNDLQWLDLGGNHIEKIPDSISRLQKLKGLFIYGEALESWPTKADNKITSLPSSIALPNLQYINLHGTTHFRRLVLNLRRKQNHSTSVFSRPTPQYRRAQRWRYTLDSDC